MKLLRLIVIALCFAGVTEIHAQSAIESAIKDLGDNVNKVYTERRNPETKKIIRISEVITVPNEKITLIKNAFEKDRQNAKKYSTYGPNTFVISFPSAGTSRDQYSLTDNILSHEVWYIEK